VQEAPALWQLHLEGRDDLHRRHVIARRLLRAALRLGLEDARAGGGLAREDLLGLLRSEQALRDERLEHERGAEVRLRAAGGAYWRRHERRPPDSSSSASTPKKAIAEAGASPQ